MGLWVGEGGRIEAEVGRGDRRPLAGVQGCSGGHRAGVASVPPLSIVCSRTLRGCIIAVVRLRSVTRCCFFWDDDRVQPPAATGTTHRRVWHGHRRRYHRWDGGAASPVPAGSPPAASSRRLRVTLAGRSARRQTGVVWTGKPASVPPPALPAGGGARIRSHLTCTATASTAIAPSLAPGHPVRHSPRGGRAVPFSHSGGMPAVTPD